MSAKTELEARGHAIYLAGSEEHAIAIAAYLRLADHFGNNTRSEDAISKWIEEFYEDVRIVAAKRKLREQHPNVAFMSDYKTGGTTNGA